MSTTKHRVITITNVRRWLVPHTLAVLVLAGCAGSLTEPNGIALRLTSVSQSAAADALEIFIDGELVNSGVLPFESGGCTRPMVAIDSLGRTGWVPIESFQNEQLIACMRTFTVDPGQTVQFLTSLRRANFAAYPVGVRLRVRVPQVDDDGKGGPSSEFVLPR